LSNQNLDGNELGGERSIVNHVNTDSDSDRSGNTEEQGGEQPKVQTGASQAGVATHPSLEGLHGTVNVPGRKASFWRQCLSYGGPALLVSVGYMDPGNWGTDVQGGAQFKYGLLWVVAVASVMAIFMQMISARLGVVTGKDLAQCCRDFYPRWSRWPQCCSARWRLPPAIWPRCWGRPWP
jgi:manganese transport protein